MTIARRLNGFVLSGFAVAALTLAGGLAASQPVQAEDLVDFLWGGSAEYGGGRSVVAFDPKYKPDQVIVSFSDRRLYLITKPGEAITYPVAVPMGDARWQGVTFVSSKRINPPWTPTPEMVRNNPRLPRWVPGGHPMNPLGVRALYLGSSAYRIHGTDAPWTIGQAVSHGCIRLTNKDVLDLYPRVKVGTRVTVTWQRFSTHAIASSGYPAYGSKASDGDDSSSSTASNDGYSSSRASHAPVDGSIGSLFFWDDKPEQRTAAAPEQASDDQASEPAPKKRSASDESAAKKISASKKEAVNEKKDAVSEKKEASAEPASEKEVQKKEASAEPATTPKKKIATASASKSKKSSAEEAKAEPRVRTLAVPDPVKPTAVVPAAAKAPPVEKASDAAPTATKTSASAEDVTHAKTQLQ